MGLERGDLRTGSRHQTPLNGLPARHCAIDLIISLSFISALIGFFLDWCHDIITVTSHERHGVLMHQQFDRLFNSLSRQATEKNQSPALLFIYGRNLLVAHAITSSWKWVIFGLDNGMHLAIIGHLLNHHKYIMHKSPFIKIQYI